MFNNFTQNTLNTILSLLKIKHTPSYANKYFNEHPNKYNMLGLSEMLYHYKIDNLGLKINKKKDILTLETPFIAHLGSDFVTVSKISEKNIKYIWNGKNINAPFDDFLNSWSGITLLVEKDDQSIEPNYKENRKKDFFSKTLKYLLSSAIITLCVTFFIHNKVYEDIGLTLLMLLNVTGIYIGYLLLNKQLNIQSSHADKICSLFSKNDCNNILESSAAKFMGIISWSELGFSYFTANALIILFFPHLLNFVVLLNILSLPYSIWSIWYQKFKAKQWCPLCLIVQALFWIQFLVSVCFNFIQTPIFLFLNTLCVALIYSISFLTVSILLSILNENKKAESIKQEFNSLRMNKKVFNTFLKEQPNYPISRETSNIIFGDINAKNVITVITNPHCEPCAKMHKRIEEILRFAKDKFCIQYIYTSFSKELDISSKYLISVFQQKNTSEMMEIYDKWFSGEKYNKEAFFHEFGVDTNYITTLEEWAKHNEWIKEARIRATPTILVNGCKLPNNYKPEQLVNLLGEE